ncbi:hypothetical protein LNAOJCKE_1740 [Methylorubrum aminovorans]|uniref:Polysaccharide biosynthesis protein n=2 Tax=Methylorubrum aminovorans TaxID=269069 RepID=A0ABQ4UBX5_9HYPH|nr:lipopolysaccharide biosynthesis protein [Methylorubrum aminovorans]GJE64534.1 hypothetical protein LNAOJCKE_1740 [Methylorubrum aminovorans]
MQDSRTDLLIDEPSRMRRLLFLRRLRAAWAGLGERGLVRGYVHLLGGSVTRLLLSLVYFISLTSALGLDDFGLFATSAAVGMVLSRLAAFGYGANMVAVSATRPRLLGRYLGSYAVWLAVSLPFCLGLALLVHWAFFPGQLLAYLTVVAVEVVVWRLIDLVAVINGGLGRYARSAAAYNIGFLARTLAALAFLGSSDHSLAAWGLAYAAANLTALLVVAATLLPRARLRLRRRSLLLRGRNALALAGAYVVSAGQGESDKVLVLALGGEANAGLFATCMRLVDLTAMPVRAFNVIMIRALLRDPAAMRGTWAKLVTEVGILIVSTAVFAVITLALQVWPSLLGREVAKAAPILPLLWAVPALRNLIEYQAELLYAWQRMFGLFWISSLLILLKSTLIAAVFWQFHGPAQWAGMINAVFLVAYLASSLGTYAFGRRGLGAADPRPLA